MLRTLGKTTWDKIKVGEVFAWNGCWNIYYKLNTRTTFLLSTNLHFAEEWIGMIEKANQIFDEKDLLYKLPESVQRLWKTE